MKLIIYFFHFMQLINLVYKTVRCSSLPKIAIVGSGVGGSSCAFFLREDFGKNLEIDVYEYNTVGGRLATRTCFGSTFEVGGSVIHERNRYMTNFRKQFVLDTVKDDSHETIAICDQNGIEFTSSKWQWVTYAKMLWRYGYSLFRLDSFIENMLTDFDRIYELQAEGRAFSTAEGLISEASSNFLHYFNVSSKDGFTKYGNINHVTIDELVKGSLRVNYGQSTDVHLFVGAVSVAGMTGKLWSVQGGNRQIPERLIKNSEVNLIPNLVLKIRFNSPDNSFLLESVNKNTGNTLSKSYDIVVLAHPVTKDSKTPIEFINFPKPIEVNGKYHRTVATILEGNLNATFFSFPENENIDLVIDNDIKDMINSVGKIRPISPVKDYSNNVWKIFSQEPLTHSELSKLFTDYKVCKVLDWLAYPHYETLRLSSNFILHPNLYYINAIEWAASAMEMSVIGAKNVALLIRNQLPEQEPVNEDKVSESIKRTEL